MRSKLVIITEIISPYRIPEFNALANRKDIDLHVVFLAETDATQRDWVIDKNELHFSYEVLPSYRKRIWGYNFLLNWGMGAALTRSAPTAVLCGGYNYFATWKALWWARRQRVPLFLWSESNSRDLRSGSRITEGLKKFFIRRCSGFLVPGRSALEYLSAHGVPEEKVFVAPNAVDNSRFAAASRMARENARAKRESLQLPERYFVFAGRLVRQKGIFDLLDAYQQLSPEIRSGVGLVFVGDGRERDELASQAAGISPGTVKIAGFAQRDELAVYYGLAEALVFPTHSDTWGLVVNEAMACGLPILVTDVAGCVADMVIPGENGFVTKLGDVRALTFGMMTLADTALRNRMAAASLARIEQFSPDEWAKGVANAVLASGQEFHGH